MGLLNVKLPNILIWRQCCPAPQQRNLIQNKHWLPRLANNSIQINTHTTKNLWRHFNCTVKWLPNCSAGGENSQHKVQMRAAALNWSDVLFLREHHQTGNDVNLSAYSPAWGRSPGTGWWLRGGVYGLTASWFHHLECQRAGGSGAIYTGSREVSEGKGWKKEGAQRTNGTWIH